MRKADVDGQSDDLTLPSIPTQTRTLAVASDLSQPLTKPENATQPMSTRSEDFAGLTVAIDHAVSRTARSTIDALQRQVEFQIEAGTTCLCPVGTTGESPTLSHPEHERVIAAVVEAAGRPDQGDGRHRLEQHRRGRAPDQVGPPRPAPTPPWSSPPTTTSRRRKASTSTSRSSPKRSTSRSASTTSPAAPARTSSRRRSSAWPKCPTSRWSRKPPARWTRRRRSSRRPT